ncbi:Pyroglutamyl-peptidase 1 [Geranomyces variabilis]|nr:Pyroglutamyl-peptidase 1 [Geranomyces variabilis]
MAPVPPTLRVLLTGFEPFGGRPTNASWTAVSQIPLTIVTSAATLIIEKVLLPVEYAPVGSTIPALHARIRPHIVLHCGLGRPHVCCLESRAASSGYVKKDNAGEIPEETEEEEEEEEEAKTYVVHPDVLCGIHAAVDDNSHNPVTISDDAGRFLCEYTLMQSLRLKTTPVTLFLHIPETSIEASVDLIERTLDAAGVACVALRDEVDAADEVEAVRASKTNGV